MAWIHWKLVLSMHVKWLSRIKIDEAMWKILRQDPPPSRLF